MNNQRRPLLDIMSDDHTGESSNPTLLEGDTVGNAGGDPHEPDDEVEDIPDHPRM